MFKSVLKISFLIVLFILLSFQSSITQTQIQTIRTQDVSKELEVKFDYGKIPLYFIPNQGQVNEEALFYAKATSYRLWLTKKGLVFDSTIRQERQDSAGHNTELQNYRVTESLKYERDVSRLIFLNANNNPEVIMADKTDHKVNYFIGRNSSKWKIDIPTSKAILYRGLYNNIDLRIYGVEKQIEYDWIVKPGGEVSDIIFEYRDVRETQIDEEGNLVVQTEFGQLKHEKPVCYQVIEGEKIGIEAGFKEIKKNTFGFIIEEYNRDYELIIDPVVLVYSTFLGGTAGDEGKSIAVDKKGAVYMTGQSY